MSYGCYIVDDEPGVAALLIDYVNRHEELHLMAYESDSGMAAKKLLSGEIRPDICFLDVQMAGINGLEMAKMVRHLTCIIFTTGYKKYALDSYELDAVDYLLKPVRYARFLEAIEKAKRYLSSNDNTAGTDTDFFFVKDVLNNKFVKINASDIIYLEGHGNFVFLHIAGSHKPIMSNLSMTAVVDKAPSQQLVKLHKRYIANLAHVLSLTGNDITMSNSVKIPLSRRYRSDFLRRLELRDTD